MTPDEKSPKPKFRNKAERNKDVITPAMVILRGKKILNERPEGMTTADYRLLRKQQTLILQAIFRKAPIRRLVGIIPVKRY